MNLINLSKLADSEANAPQLFSAVYTNRYIKKKVASRCPLNASTKGRSMVEMLGVLAIVGVLSVGAIAGYSKAMMKYRLNKTTDIATQLFATTFTKFAHDFSSLSADEYGSAYLTPIMLKAGWVPDGLKPKENVPSELLDPFGNGVWIFRQTDRRIGIGWGFKKSQQELCYNFLTLSKSWAENLSSVTIDHSASPDGSVQRKEYGTFYGNSKCVKGVKCLADITIADMDRVCNKCEQSGCRIYFYSNVM